MGEERAIYVVIALASLPVVIASLLHGGALDSGATISLLLVTLALVGLLPRRRCPRLPRARVHPRRARRWHGLRTDPGRGSDRARMPRAPALDRDRTWRSR